MTLYANRREKRGIQPRAVRAAVIGFPNVGKSALINRLLGVQAELFILLYLMAMHVVAK